MINLDWKPSLRGQCALKGTKDLEPLFTFKNFPIFMGCVTTPPEEDIFFDMNWWISPSSGSIQLDPVVPLEVLYRFPHNESFGDIWKEHHRQFAGLLAKYQGRHIIEIGGGNGLLADLYLQQIPDAKWTLIDVNARESADPRIQVRRQLLDLESLALGPGDTVVHSHFIEHCYSPRDFLASLAAKMPIGSRHIFSVPDLRTLLERGHTNALNFEHTLFLTDEFLEVLLSRSGFQILEKHSFRQHSLFLSTVRAESEPLPWPNRTEDYRSLFLKFVQANQTAVQDLNSRLKERVPPVFLFGAHIFSQVLLNLGLDQSRISGILDNGPLKQGKRLYGTPFIAQSPSILREIETPTVILKASVYNHEIKRDIWEKHNPRTVFWE